VLTLGVRPSALPEVYWSHTLNDLKVMVKLRMEYDLANANQGFENLILTASKIFGGSSKTSTTRTFTPQSADEAEAWLRSQGIG
jgi:hypothetical protein